MVTNPSIRSKLLQMLFAGNTDFLREHAFLLPAITLYAAIQILVSSFAMLALSSLSRSRRFVAMVVNAAGKQELQRVTRTDGDPEIETLLPVSFVPLVEGAAKEP